MNRKIIFLCTVALLLPTLLSAKNAPQFGYVNIAEAMMLHPLMKNFNTDSRRFTLDAVKDDDNLARTNNMKKIETEKKEINKNIAKLEKERGTHESKYLDELKKLARRRKSQSEASGFSLKEYNEERGSIDKEFHLKVYELNRKLRSMQDRLTHLERETEYASHASHEDSQRIFSLILDDVYEAVDKVATFYKIPFIFNSSFEFAKSGHNISIANPMGTFFDNIDQRISLEDEGELTFAAEVKAWLDSRNTNLNSINDNRLTGFVLKGGVNMTPAVIDYIFQKHKVGETQREFIQDFYKKIISQEH